MLTFLGAILAGLVCGVLSGFGIGGGSLLMVWMTAVLSMDQKAAQGVNLGVGDAAQLHLLAVKDHGARIGMLQKVHAAQKRCFAAAAGAEDGHDIALLDIEIDAP